MRNHVVAIQGITSSFHDIAAKKYFGEEISILECGSFRDVCQQLASNAVDYGIIAIENRIAGSILLNYSLIEQFNLYVIGEIFLPIELSLLAKKGTKLSDVQEVISHPMALGQCQEFLSKHPQWSVSEYKDTAASAEYMLEQPTNHIAVIAGKAVAKRFDLEVLAENCSDESMNYTRFYILSKNKDVAEHPDKASISVRVGHAPGSLYEVLGTLKDYDINLTKIQSVPVPGDASSYSFHLDLSFNQESDLLAALEVLKLKTLALHVLGIYKGEETPIN